MTRRNVLRSADENDWHSLQAIHLLASLAALLHDLGKATRAFQDRLKPGSPVERNQYRHEWVSLRLFESFVGNSGDAEWLQRLIAPTPADDASWTAPGRLLRDGLDTAASKDKPFAKLPPLARGVGWLILTHHRLPVMPATDAEGRRLWLGARVRNFSSAQLDQLLEKVDAEWNEQPTSTAAADLAPYWDFPHGLPVTTELWRKRAARLATRLQTQLASTTGAEPLADPYVMHLARLGLMLADHHYSSLTDRQARSDLNDAYPLYANTVRKTGAYNQTLDEHLLGVARHAGVVAHALPGFELHLARLARHKGLRRRSADPRFRWQDRAADLAAAVRERSARQGAFIVDMASTGCGKTLANARIMYALADPARGMRCAFALGLRTLTLQTGRAFRKELQLSEEEVAILVGGAPNRELFNYYEAQAEATGSASTQDLLAKDSHVVFEGNARHPLLQRLGHAPQVHKLLAAPLLVCTIDHLTPATESQRGGRQIAPMLRLMSGDLVLDEPDDFDIDDLPALARLVHWAGLLGARVLLSSATLPPALVEGLFDAYRDGRSWFQRNRGKPSGTPPEVCCIWVDEYRQTATDCADVAAFASAHLDFARQRHTHLGAEAVRRRSALLPFHPDSHDPAVIRQQFASSVREAALRLHADHHDLAPHSGKRISFGLVRMANIDPLLDVALALFALGAPENVRIHLCPYHARFPLIVRSEIEHRLDAALNRRRPQAAFDLPEIRALLDASPEADHLFIVLGSPVCEVGRDHDYDWAVVEPSSMRSLIQLAGRIRRHRPNPVATPNLLVFETNLRHFEHPGKPAYWKPGFETRDAPFHLQTHDLAALLAPAEREVIDARPRILPRPDAELAPDRHLVDLEHARLDQQMRPQQDSAGLTAYQIRAGRKPKQLLNATSHWLRPGAWLTAVLPQQQPFRADPEPTVDLALLPDEDESACLLHRVVDQQRGHPALNVPVEESLQRLPDATVTGARIAPWIAVDLLDALATQANAQDIPLSASAQRYATVTVPDSEQGWRFHPVLGFGRRK
ncbi:type I-F CRISPR-associated helicase Cas3f [Cognatazoarcus halotolerans]|uniref:type I-F CRISPR-associated helicase Cas3f n=1 Tax=Cognatazoarcus halotolerans TaxID=2686016 RepID=UPI001F1F4248|nr:type I-F CRISPR-associated helicase Cas3f [Cognatazoarcus halotolerans]